MRNTERRPIAAQLGDSVEQRRVRSTLQQRREQRVFLSTRSIDLVGLTKVLGIEIRPQDGPCNPGRGFHRQHTPGRDP
jgi:hypothetical protein